VRGGIEGTLNEKGVCRGFEKLEGGGSTEEDPHLWERTKKPTTKKPSRKNPLGGAPRPQRECLIRKGGVAPSFYRMGGGVKSKEDMGRC